VFRDVIRQTKYAVQNTRERESVRGVRSGRHPRSVLTHTPHNRPSTVDRTAPAEKHRQATTGHASRHQPGPHTLPCWCVSVAGHTVGARRTVRLECMAPHHRPHHTPHSLARLVCLQYSPYAIIFASVVSLPSFCTAITSVSSSCCTLTIGTPVCCDERGEHAVSARPGACSGGRGFGDGICGASSLAWYEGGGFGRC
jgi:hypothetical protein